MNKQVFIRLVSVLSLVMLIGVLAARAQFEGIISYKQKSGKDTLLCNFYVKEPMVKYEEIFSNGSIKRYIVADLSKGESVSVYPSQNLVEHHKLSSEKPTDIFSVEKKQNKSSIQGMDCMQWIVKNETKKEMVLYYVYQEDFTFFAKFCSLAINFSDLFEFYATIKNSAGYMPMRMKKTDLLWKPIKELSLLSIDRQSIPNNSFDIPKP